MRAYNVAKVAGPRSRWPDQEPSNVAVILYDAAFPQSSEAVGLSQVSKMLQQLTGQLSAHYSSSKIKKTYLRLFRPDQGPHTVHRSVNIALFALITKG